MTQGTADEQNRERAATREFTDAIDPKTFLDIFRTREDACEPLGATEVAERMDVVRRTAFNKLNELTDDILKSKKISNACV